MTMYEMLDIYPTLLNKARIVNCLSCDLEPKYRRVNYPYTHTHTLTSINPLSHNHECSR